MARRSLGPSATRDRDLVTRAEAAALGGASPSAGTFVDASQNNVNQQISGGQFVKVNLPTKNRDEDNRFDATTSEYIVRESGIYTCAAVLRIPDDDQRIQNIGMGIHASNFDGPWFLWNVTRNDNLGPIRQSFPYARTAFFVKDDLLRLYVYSGLGFTVQAAQMTIMRTGYAS